MDARLKPRALDHGALVVADVERSLRFYTEVVGLPEVARPATFDFPGAWVQVGDQQLHIIGEGEAGRARALHPGYTAEELRLGYGVHVALVVDDLDVYESELRAAGGEPTAPIRARGDGVRQLFVQDPDGHIVEFMDVGADVTGAEPEIRPPGS